MLFSGFLFPASDLSVKKSVFSSSTTGLFLPNAGDGIVKKPLVPMVAEVVPQPANQENQSFQVPLKNARTGTLSKSNTNHNLATRIHNALRRVQARRLGNPINSLAGPFCCRTHGLFLVFQRRGSSSTSSRFLPPLFFLSAGGKSGGCDAKPVMHWRHGGKKCVHHTTCQSRCSATSST